jgi:hypothetical protein
MTAKEKAKELLERYDFISTHDGLDIMDEELTMLDRKQCALIAVDEMLDFRNGLYINEGSLAHQWLLDVKQEIEKL